MNCFINFFYKIKFEVFLNQQYCFSLVTSDRNKIFRFHLENITHHNNFIFLSYVKIQNSKQTKIIISLYRFKKKSDYS